MHINLYVWWWCALSLLSYAVSCHITQTIHTHTINVHATKQNKQTYKTDCTNLFGHKHDIMYKCVIMYTNECVDIAIVNANESCARMEFGVAQTFLFFTYTYTYISEELFSLWHLPMMPYAPLILCFIFSLQLVLHLSLSLSFSLVSFGLYISRINFSHHAEMGISF